MKSLYKQEVPVENVVIGTIDGNEIVIEVKKYLSFENLCQFVAEMEGAEFSNDVYVPQVSHVLLAKKMCEYYTNVNLPPDISEAYEMIVSLGLLSKIYDVASCNSQFAELLALIDDAQRHTYSQKTGLNGLFASIKKAVDGFDINGVLKDLKSFDPSSLENLTDLKQIAGLLTQRLSPDSFGHTLEATENAEV